jgi:hypothetical protein
MAIPVSMTASLAVNGTKMKAMTLCISGRKG